MDAVSRQRPCPLTQVQETAICSKACAFVTFVTKGRSSQDFMDADFCTLLKKTVSYFFPAPLPPASDRTGFHLSLPYVVRVLSLCDESLRRAWFPISTPQQGKRDAPTIALSYGPTTWGHSPRVPTKAGLRLVKAIDVLQKERWRRRRPAFIFFH